MRRIPIDLPRLGHLVFLYSPLILQCQHFRQVAKFLGKWL